MAQIQDSTIFIHRGDGRFDAIQPNGDILDLGDKTIGMIRYTYFEDFTLPEMGWNVSQKQLMKDYMPKIMKDIQSGKIRPDENGDIKEGYE